MWSTRNFDPQNIEPPKIDLKKITKKCQKVPKSFPEITTKNGSSKQPSLALKIDPQNYPQKWPYKMTNINDQIYEMSQK